MSTTTTEMTEKVEQVKVASGFAKRNANKKRIEEVLKRKEKHKPELHRKTEQNTVWYKTKKWQARR